MVRAWSVAALGVVLMACSSSGGTTGTSTTTGSGAGGGTLTTSASTTGSGGSGGASTTTGTTGSGGSGGSSTTTGSGGSGGGGTLIGPGPYFLSYSAPGPGIDSRPSVTATFEGNEITGYVAGAMESPTRGTALTAEPGMDAFVAWGRWSGGTTAGILYNNPGIALSATQGFHLALGLRTDPAAVPASGGADYTLLGATHATIEDGSFALGTITGSMKVAYAGAMTKVGLALSIDMPGDAVYTVTTAGGTATPASSEIGSLTAINPARLAGDVAVVSPGKACTVGVSCKAVFQGFLAGPSADRVALVFTLSAGQAGTQVRGVVVFQRQ